MATQEYPKTAANSVNRKKDRGRYDADFIHGMINQTTVCHVSFVPDPDEPSMPIILPMIGMVGHYPGSNSTQEHDPEAEPHIYLHGYVSSRIMKLAEEAVKSGNEGLPICIAATKVDGLVLALTPFNHSYDYRSAVITGHAVVCEDPDEKLWALRLVTNGVVPERWENSRIPDKADLTATRILKVGIDRASGKVRTGQAHDDRKDMKNEEVRDRVWTGTVPLFEQYGDPCASDYNRIKSVPGHIGDFVKAQNETLKSEALERTRED